MNAKGEKKVLSAPRHIIIIGKFCTLKGDTKTQQDFSPIKAT